MPSGNAAAKAYRAAHKAARAGDYRQARTSFLGASSLDHDNPLYLHAAAGATCRIGRYRDAEGLYRKAIAVAERTMGAGQPQVALVAYSLVELYENQGRIDEARQLSVRVVDHLDWDLAIQANGQSLQRLSALFRNARYPATGEALYRDALCWRKRVFGPDRAKVAECEAGLETFLSETDAHAGATAG